jgi:hypothetical protein
MERFIYWAPRVLSILFIAFLSLFSLDVFEEATSFWQVVVGLLMHNIPSFVLAGVGGVMFIAAGLLYISFGIKNAPDWPSTIMWSLIIAGPAFLIGALFFINWSKREQ